MVAFEDVMNFSTRALSQYRNEHSTPILRKVGRLDQSNINEAFASGGIVNMFDILELLSKPQYLSDFNQVTLKVIEELKPYNERFITNE